MPRHSTLSSTRQLLPEALFELLFDRVFSLCVGKGMVSGDAQAIDSAPVKANASMDGLKLKQPAEPASMQVANEGKEPAGKQDKSSKSGQYISAPDHQLRKLEKYQENLKSSPGSLGGHHEKAQLLSNKTHYSPTDPDARI